MSHVAEGRSVKERPIIFSGPMVTAILAGQKTQTRRVMKPQPSEDWAPHSYGEVHKMLDGEFLYRNEEPVIGGWGPSSEDGMEAHPCPFGRPGDRLWVREAWHDFGRWALLMFAEGDDPSDYEWRSADFPERIRYAADDPTDLVDMNGPDYPRLYHRKMASIHMPRWASRILLEVVSVRVERLQDITIDDVVAEGIDLDGEHAQDFIDAEHAQAGGLSLPCDHPEVYPFVRVWDSINARKPDSAWKDNPWVWVVELKRVEATND